MTEQRLTEPAVYDFYRLAASRLDYAADTGKFVWHNKAGIQHRMRGMPAGNVCADGYVYMRFKRYDLLAHRLAWLMSYGVIPPSQIDHINMNRSDNRLVNLRLATIAENNRNRGVQSNNTTGYKGVTRDKKTGRYYAKIQIDKRLISLGCFVSPESAGAAYHQAALEHHGEFARVK